MGQVFSRKHGEGFLFSVEVVFEWDGVWSSRRLSLSLMHAWML